MFQRKMLPPCSGLQLCRFRNSFGSVEKFEEGSDETQGEGVKKGIQSSVSHSLIILFPMLIINQCVPYKGHSFVPFFPLTRAVFLSLPLFESYDCHTCDIPM
jgi:hypothetical protein